MYIGERFQAFGTRRIMPPLCHGLTVDLYLVESVLSILADEVRLGLIVPTLVGVAVWQSRLAERVV